MSDIALRAQVEVDRPHDQVWATLADYGSDPRWRAGVLTMVPEPPGLVTPRTRTVEHLRFLGRTWRNVGQVTAVEPGSRFAWRTTSGAAASGERAVVALGSRRSRVEMTLRVRPSGVERLFRPLLARALDRTLQGDVQRLRALLEAADAPLPAAEPARRS